MRIALLALLSIAAPLAAAAPAMADITVAGLPVHACTGGVCTPCPDPVVVPEPLVDVTVTGVDCSA